MSTNPPSAEPSCHMVMLVLTRTELLDDVLDAWRAAGVGGTTIVESMGLYRRQQQRTRLHMRFHFEVSATRSEQRGQYTLFAVVPDEASVERCREAAEGIIGDLGGPDTGILVSWPLGYAKGITLHPRTEADSP